MADILQTTFSNIFKMKTEFRRVPFLQQVISWSRAKSPLGLGSLSNYVPVILRECVFCALNLQMVGLIFFYKTKLNKLQVFQLPASFQYWDIMESAMIFLFYSKSPIARKANFSCQYVDFWPKGLSASALLH